MVPHGSHWEGLPGVCGGAGTGRDRGGQDAGAVEDLFPCDSSGGAEEWGSAEAVPPEMVQGAYDRVPGIGSEAGA